MNRLAGSETLGNIETTPKDANMFHDTLGTVFGKSHTEGSKDAHVD